MCDHCFFKPGCVRNVQVKLDTEFEIPERNDCVKPRTKNKKYNYGRVNSCNGLLCSFITYHDNDPPIVCNPITVALLYVDPKENRMRSLNAHGIEPIVEAIAHIPSFVLLKHAPSGQNVKVLNVRSRCAESKLHGEAKDIDIVEEEFYHTKDIDIVEEEFYHGSDSSYCFDYAYDSSFDSDSDFNSSCSSETDSISE